MKKAYPVTLRRIRGTPHAQILHKDGVRQIGILLQVTGFERFEVVFSDTLPDS